MSRHVFWCYAMSWHAMLCYVMICYVMSLWCVPCHVCVPVPVQFGVVWCGVVWCDVVYVLRYCAIWCCVWCHTARWTTYTEGLPSSSNLSTVPFLSSSLSPIPCRFSHSLWSFFRNQVINILIIWLSTHYTHILEQFNICQVRLLHLSYIHSLSSSPYIQNDISTFLS